MDKKMPSSIIEMARKYPYYVREHGDFQLDRPLGKGGFGVVWHAIDKKTGGDCALKELFARKLDDKLTKTFIAEVTTMAECSNRFICQLVGFTLEHPYSIITTYQPNGDLKEIIKKYINRKSFSGTHLTTIALGISHAIECLHTNGFIHRDLKSTNILMDAQQMPRLGDFGISRCIPRDLDKITRRIGTPAYMAPEVFLGSKYSTPADIYSFGLILFEMSECHVPFEQYSREQLFSLFKGDEITLPFTKITPKPLKDLINKCISKDPQQRPTATEIFNQFASGKVVFSNSDKKKINQFAKKIIEADKKMKENPPPLPQQYCDVEEMIKKYQKNDALEDENENQSKKDKNGMFELSNSSDSDGLSGFENNELNNNKQHNAFIPIPPKQFYDKYQINNEIKIKIDPEIIQNPQNENYYNHICEIADNMTDAIASNFIEQTINYFTEIFARKFPDVILFFYKIYYKCMQKSSKFISLLYQYNFFTSHLFFFSNEMEEICMDILVLLFEKKPILIDRKITELITNLEGKQEYLIILMSKYVEKLPVLQLSLPIITEFLKIYQLFTEKDTIIQYLRMISFAFNKNKILAKCLQFKTTDLFSYFLTRNDSDITLECYKSMIITKCYVIQIPENFIVNHLNDKNIQEYCIKYLALSDSFPYSYNIVPYLMKLVPHILIPKILIKAALINKNIAFSIAGDSKWMSPCKFNQKDACCLLLSALRFTQSADYLAANQNFPPLTAFIVTSNESSVLIYLSQILLLFIRTPDAVRIFSQSNTLKEFLQQCSQSNDQNVLLASLNVLDACLRFDYSSSFTKYIPKLVEMLRYQNDLTTRSIIVIVSMSNFPEGASALKSAGLTEYFQNLSQVPNYSNLANQFLNNVR